jgi:asparagine synthase (glutamine-hydrolysing)
MCWGKEMLNRLNGMFSFAIWDTHGKKLFAARDRFGVKPFYYSFVSGNFIFASEIKSIWSAGLKKEPNLKLWSSYFCHGNYGSMDETFWEEIKQLPGGYMLEYDNNKLKIKKWYNFVSNVKSLKKVTDLNGHIEYYEEILKHSIRLRLRSDVKLGFNISGGLDSSVLLAFVNMMSCNNASIEAYTFTTGDRNYDELPWVNEMIKITHHPLNECRLDIKDVPSYARTIQDVQDEPYGGIPTLAYANIFRTARNTNTIVLLDGQGMDEQFAGYDYYQKSTNVLLQGSASEPVRPNCMLPDFLKLGEIMTYPEPFDERMKNLQYRDLFFTKIPRALRFNDRVSMAYSTELREPFLDYRLVEYAFSLPVDLKVRNGQGKWMLRKLASKILPDTVSLAPKRPVQTPQREWLRGPLKDWALDCIHLGMNSVDWFDCKKVFRECEEYFDGKSDNSFYIWQWLTLGLIFGKDGKQMCQTQ